MSEIPNIDDNNEDDGAELDNFDAQTDTEMDEAGDDPVKLKDIIKKRSESRQRLYTRLKAAETKAKDAKPEVKKPASKKEEGLDRVDKAILRVEKITDSDEVDLVQSIMKETGKDLEAVLESKYFKSELAALRQDRETKDAIPNNSKRTGQSTRDSVEYWLAKGELPKDNPALKIKVVNAKIAREKDKNQFSDNPIR